MFNLEEEIKAWKNLLDTGEIDEATYEKEVNKLIQKSEKNKQHKKIDVLNLLKSYPKIIIIFVICVVGVCFFIANNANKNIGYVSSLNDLPRPQQGKTSGKVYKMINGDNVEITRVASYCINGRVVDVQKYIPYNIENQLSPIDVGISWGFLARAENNKKINWFSAGNRFLSWRSDDGMWINQMGGVNRISEYNSNNHLIASDENTEKLIKMIKKNDYIRIDGYLVNAYCRRNDGSYFTWNTSTSRNDSGNGACEIIYVTNVTWLREQR